jgi:hypothetical protein
MEVQELITRMNNAGTLDDAVQLSRECLKLTMSLTPDAFEKTAKDQKQLERANREMNKRVTAAVHAARAAQTLA